MGVGAIIGLILLPFVWILMAGVAKQHRDETGVGMPSRNTMKNIRRTARRKGISEGQAYNDWLRRKQRSRKS